MSRRSRAVVVDVDGTVCERFTLLPIPQGIDFCERHHDTGHAIVIMTARPEWRRGHRALVAAALADAVRGAVSPAQRRLAA